MYRLGVSIDGQMRSLVRRTWVGIIDQYTVYDLALVA